MFKNNGGNFPGGNFPGGNFPGGSLMGGNFPGGNFPSGSFPDTIKIVWNHIMYLCKKTFWGVKYHYGTCRRP